MVSHAATAHPVVAAADLHLRLAQIDPLIYENGRVCRLVMNLRLIQRGYPLAIIRAAKTQRAGYYQALVDSDHSSDPSVFRALIAARVLESLHGYQEVLG